MVSKASISALAAMPPDGPLMDPLMAAAAAEVSKSETS